MQYQLFDPADCNFPKPRVPLLPLLAGQSLGRRSSRLYRQMGEDNNTRFYARGRYALRAAYQLAGVGQSGALLVPSYHCRTMLDPAIRLGAKILFYPLHPELSPDTSALASLVACSKEPITALLLTHYFGFSQDLGRVADFCKQNSIALIEDCSHALFSASTPDCKQTKLPMGKTGRFGVASPYKFFPVEDGGLLWANEPHHLAPDTRTPRNPTQEVKAMLHMVQRAFDRPRTPDSSLIGEEIRTLSDKAFSEGHDALVDDAQISGYYDTLDEDQPSLTSSRWVIRHTPIDRLASRRRENYMQWVQAVASLPCCKALFPVLPTDCVPYMFPLLIDRPENHFFTVKQIGVPIWRWDSMAVSGCAVAADYRLRLLHIPCHQELTSEQMAWMTQTVQKVMCQLPRQN